MDVVGAMAAYLPAARVYTARSRAAAALDRAVYTRATGKYAAIAPTTSISTDKLELLL